MMEESKKIVLGLIGKTGSGKTFVANYLKNNLPSKNVEIIKISDFLKMVLIDLNLPITAINFQQAAKILKEEKGKFALRDLVNEAISSAKSDIIIVDGIRGENILNLVKNTPNNLLVYIESNENDRYQRVKERNEKFQEADLSRDEFSKIENSVSESFVPELKSSANVIIKNTGTKSELEEKMENLIKYINSLS
jgi:uridine kinase